MIPYEFTTEDIKAEEDEIQERLILLEKKGYTNYGVTIRPV